MSEAKIVPVDNGDVPLEDVKEKIQVSPTTVDPHGSFMRQWDLLMLLLLTFTASVTPFEVSFLKPGIDVLFFVNRIVDLGFILDMGLTFFVGYIDDETSVYVHQKPKIALRYFKGWFIIDLVSIIPFDILGMVMNSESVSQLKILRIIRLLRLIKLLRILRSARIFKRIQTSLGLSFSSFSLLKLLNIVVFVVHWTACLWNLGPSLEDAPVNWITELAPDFSPGELYVACLEFSLQAMVMGYGDFTPITHVERAIAVFSMLAGGAVYAYVIGDICGVVANRDPATAEYEQTVDLLNQYIEEHQLPHDLRVSLRQYFLYCKDLIRGTYYQGLLEQMSPQLKGSVATFMNGDWIAKIAFFNAENHEERNAFVTALATSLEALAYSPNEVIFQKGDAATKFYLIGRGIVGTEGRIRKKEDFFGTDMIAGLILKDPRRITSARSLTFIDVNVLTLEALEEILDSGDFEETTKLIRKAALRVALRRTVLEMSRQYRAAFDLPRSENHLIEEWKANMALKRQHKKDVAEIIGSARESDNGAAEETKEVEALSTVDQVKKMSCLEWWDSKRNSEEKEEDDIPVIVANVNTPQLDSVLLRLNSLERTVARLSIAMDKGFKNLRATQSSGESTQSQQ